jgi:DNA-binding winged helix-turn-helix (wHTH) protein/Tol biopolymer transport system component
MQGTIIRFDEFELDILCYQLRRSGRLVRLEKLPMELLILLSEKPGQLVTREEIIQRLWGDNVFVDARQGINTAIRKLRVALRDNSNRPRILQTVVGKGYRLVALKTVAPEILTEKVCPEAAAQPRAQLRPIWIVALAAVVVGAIGVVSILRVLRNHELLAAKGPSDWVQLTNFADSAVSPALSPDGHMLAFMRDDRTFLGRGPIYLKLLPNGKPVQLASDRGWKMGLQFSPDGSQVAYTVGPNKWETWTVPVLGGEPQLFLPNAAGLTWIDKGHVLFSEIKNGVHMAVVTATDSRSESRNVYAPPRERGMAHRSAISPDHKWVLLAEMDSAQWLRCRLVPFDGSSAGKQVGPVDGACTNVAWSPDGKWMFLNSNSGGHFHIWRQYFPDGPPQAVTSGITDEEGIAVAADGRSLVTSVGMVAGTLWLHDGKGVRQLSPESDAQQPRFSPDGTNLYYLLPNRALSSQFVRGELHVANLQGGGDQPLLPGLQVTDYDISPDGKRIAFSAIDQQGHSRLWLAPLTLLSSPRQFISATDEDSPVFDSSGHIYFRAMASSSNFVYRMREDGGERVRVLAEPILGLDAVSPDGKWVIVMREIPAEKDVSFGTLAVPLGGGDPITICHGFCSAGWTPNARFFVLYSEVAEAGKTILVPASAGQSLPSFPAGRLGEEPDLEKIKGAWVLTGFIDAVFAPELYVSFHGDAHRNLYRVPLQ